MKKIFFCALLPGLAISTAVNAQMGMPQNFTASQFSSLENIQTFSVPNNLNLPEIKLDPIIKKNTEIQNKSEEAKNEQGTRLEISKSNKLKKNGSPATFKFPERVVFDLQRKK